MDKMLVSIEYIETKRTVRKQLLDIDLLNAFFKAKRGLKGDVVNAYIGRLKINDKEWVTISWFTDTNGLHITKKVEFFHYLNKFPFQDFINHHIEWQRIDKQTFIAEYNIMMNGLPEVKSG